VRTLTLERPGSESRHARLGAVVLTLAGLVLTAGCSRSDDEPTVASPTTTVSASATSSTVASEVAITTTTVSGAEESQAVLASYRAFWDTYIAASNPMNPEHPALAERAAGEELDTVRRTLLARKSAGEVFQGTMNLSPTIIAVTGDRATVRDCHDDNLVVVDAATGTVKEPDDPVRKLVTVTLTRVEEVWKVTGIKLESEGCAG
jgi:hypothetical protein